MLDGFNLLHVQERVLYTAIKNKQYSATTMNQR